jgi:hypothetical protein
MQDVVILKNWPVKGFFGRCLSVCGPEPCTPLTHCSRVYSIQYLFTHGRGEGWEIWSREKVTGATVHKAGSKIPTWLTVPPLLQSINSDKQLPLYRSIFLDDDILLWCLQYVVIFLVHGTLYWRLPQNYFVIVQPVHWGNGLFTML